MGAGAPNLSDVLYLASRHSSCSEAFNANSADTTLLKVTNPMLKLVHEEKYKNK